MNPDSIVQVVHYQSIISPWMLFLYAFSGTGAALVTFWLTEFVKFRKGKSKEKRRKKELLRIVFDEVDNNAKHLLSMLTDPQVRPYWLFSTQSFNDIATELSSLMKEDSSVLNVIYASNRNINLLNRQLNLLHYRKEGIKASIYLDSTLPLAEKEFVQTRQLRIRLGKLLDLDVDDIQHPDEEINKASYTYSDLRDLYTRAKDQVEEYWELLAQFGKTLYEEMAQILECDQKILRVSRMDDPDGMKYPSFFDTLHFRNTEDGTYRFRINMVLGDPSTETLKITIPVIIWIHDRNIHIRIRNGEYKYVLPIEGEHDFSVIAKKLLNMIRTRLERNILDIEPI
ncbi:MAG: hypothetical protein ACTSWQ_08030 [Candidatus Thorarchaeota archaeon]